MAVIITNGTNSIFARCFLVNEMKISVKIFINKIGNDSLKNVPNPVAPLKIDWSFKIREKFKASTK